MAIPTNDLAELLEASGDVPEGVSVYAGPANQLSAPAVLLRPDEPWIVPDRFCDDEQRYVAIAVVTASSPIDGMGSLYQIARGIIAAIQGTSWEWVSVGAPVIDETTGTAFLAAPIKLKYRNTEEEVS